MSNYLCDRQETIDPSVKRALDNAIRCERCEDPHPLKNLHAWQPPDVLHWMVAKDEYWLCSNCINNPLGPFTENMLAIETESL